MSTTQVAPPMKEGGPLSSRTKLLMVIVAVVSLVIVLLFQITNLKLSFSPPEKTTSTLATPRNSTVVIRARRCQPILELYEVSQRPSLLCTFGTEAKEFDLSPGATYLLVLINDVQDSNWSNDFQIVANSDGGTRTLMSVTEGGFGQAAIRREIALIEPNG